MIAPLLALALAFSPAQAPAQAQPRAPARATIPQGPPPSQTRSHLDTLLAECRAEAIAAYAANDQDRIARYVVRLLADQEGNRERLIACGAYLAGVMDTAAGFFPTN